MKIVNFFQSLLSYNPAPEYNFSMTDYQNKNQNAESTSFLFNNSNESNTNVFSSISVNIDYMKTKYNLLINSDIILREFTLNARGKQYNAFLVYIDGMINSKIMDEFILEPLMMRNRNNLYNGSHSNVISETINNNITVRKIKKFDLASYITNCLMPQNTIKQVSKFEDAISGINSRQLFIICRYSRYCLRYRSKRF